MPKRKRPYNELKVVDDNLGTLPDRAFSIQEKQVEQRIAIGKKALNRALKLAKGFERRKLGRRLKAARVEGSTADVVRLASEVEVLKVLNLPRLAESYIYKSLARSKSISSSPAFPQWVSTAAKASRTGPDDRKTHQFLVENNVTARLYNSNPVKEAMADLLGAVQSCLGLWNIGNNGSQRVQKTQEGSRAQASSFGRLAPDSNLVGENMSTAVEPRIGDKDWLSSNRATGVSGPEDEQDGPGLSKYDNQIAGAEDEESELSYDSGDGKGATQRLGEISPRAYDPEADLSLSPPPSESSSPSPPPLKSRKQNKSPATPKSTFLPSLMGGYWSGSESAAEDQTVDAQPRKNRMGQRARRQLWERKFGAKANHLKGIEKDRDWDPKRGARVIDNGGVPRPKLDGFRGTNVATKHSRTGDKPSERKGPDKPRSSVKINEGPLHPSWEAAKKAKKQAMQATFQGKKIVFD
ncbi:hypothetical protein FGG08_005373 [Glutinoglossum americanum]|uniref:Bud22 domain-containing protein n=1 Tax=Glutinoglossum americanum TaxID=1670608 RepID=A0A9P8I350_9PEZI|nr:hypothetical protein FGG08_005373 [Glutinoglossum americanum]